MDAWPQVGIGSFDGLRASLVEVGQAPPTDRRAFWAGAKTHAFRRQLLEWGANHSDIADFRSVEWQRTDPSDLASHTPTYVSLVQHAEWAVLVDAPGGGHSARLPLLFATGRPVIAIDRPHETEVFWRLMPWVHYIPSEATLESLAAAVRWAVVEHPEEAAAIGKAGQAAILSMTSHEAVDAWTAERMSRWSLQQPG
jgi:hypothetical protein